MRLLEPYVRNWVVHDVSAGGQIAAVSDILRAIPGAVGERHWVGEIENRTDLLSLHDETMATVLLLDSQTRVHLSGPLTEPQDGFASAELVTGGTAVRAIVAGAGSTQLQVDPARVTTLKVPFATASTPWPLALQREPGPTRHGYTTAASYIQSLRSSGGTVERQRGILRVGVEQVHDGVEVARLRRELGLIHLNAGELPEALVEFTLAADAHAGDFYAKFHRCRVLTKLGAHRLAYVGLHQLLAVVEARAAFEPDVAAHECAVHIEFGLAAFHLGHLDIAAQSFEFVRHHPQATDSEREIATSNLEFCRVGG